MVVGLRVGRSPDESSRRTRTDDGVTMEVVVVQALEVLGSLFVLAAFAAAQRGVVSTRSRVYLVSNLIGSAILAVMAVIEFQVGFILLEGCWAVVSAAGLLNARSRRLSAGSRRQPPSRPTGAAGPS